MQRNAEVRSQNAEVNSALPLTSAFFDRDPRAVARSLLGKLLIRKSGGIEDDAVMAAIKNARYKPAMCATDPVVADIIVGVRESY